MHVSSAVPTDWATLVELVDRYLQFLFNSAACMQPPERRLVLAAAGLVSIMHEFPRSADGGDMSVLKARLRRSIALLISAIWLWVERQAISSPRALFSLRDDPQLRSTFIESQQVESPIVAVRVPELYS
jgi:hypothetical protein